MCDNGARCRPANEIIQDAIAACLRVSKAGDTDGGFEPRPGVAYASCFAMLASVCKDLVPIMPKDFPMEIFEVMARDPEFEGFAGNIMQLSTLELETMRRGKGRDTPTIEELDDSVTKVVFGRAFASTGGQALSQFSQLNGAEQIWKELSDHLPGSHVVWSLFLVAMPPLIAIGREYTRSGRTLTAIKHVWEDHRVEFLCLGLLVAHYGTLVQLSYNGVDRPSDWKSPVSDSFQTQWNKNTIHGLTRPSAIDMLKLQEKWNLQNIRTKANNEWFRQSNDTRMNMYYKSKGEKFPLSFQLFETAQPINSFFRGAAIELDEPIPEYDKPSDPQREQVTLLNEWYWLVVTSESEWFGGNKYENMRLLQNVLLTMIAMVYVGAKLNSMSESGRPVTSQLSLIRWVAENIVRLKNIGGAEGIASRELINNIGSQSQIDHAADLCAKLANADYPNVSLVVRYMQKLFRIRTKCNLRRGGVGAIPILRPGQMHHTELRPVLDIIAALNALVIEYNGRHPMDTIAPCDGGGSNVVDALFARVGL